MAKANTNADSSRGFEATLWAAADKLRGTLGAGRRGRTISLRRFHSSFRAPPTMSSDGSVTHWLAELRAGNPAAAQPLWERYFRRLVGLARQKLGDLPRRAFDEEDVALSAFASFCQAAQAGRFPQLADRDDLWRLLVEITAHKAYNARRNQQRQKRGGGGVRGESALVNPADAETAQGFEQVVGAEPTPEFAAQVAEECRRLLDLLGDPELRSIAVWKMEGDTAEQIAAKLDCALSTVERRLRLIRQIWERDRAP